MLKHIETVSVCLAYISAIEYRDFSGLNDDEEKWVDAFLAEFGSCKFEWSETTEFATDYISGLMGDCLECKVFKWVD